MANDKKEPSSLNVRDAMNLIYETLEPFSPEQRQQIMRAAATLLGVKASGPGAGAPRDNKTQPPQGGGRRG